MHKVFLYVIEIINVNMLNLQYGMGWSMMIFFECNGHWEHQRKACDQSDKLCHWLEFGHSILLKNLHEYNVDNSSRSDGTEQYCDRIGRTVCANRVLAKDDHDDAEWRHYGEQCHVNANQDNTGALVQQLDTDYERHKQLMRTDGDKHCPQFRSGVLNANGNAVEDGVNGKCRD